MGGAIACGWGDRTFSSINIKGRGTAEANFRGLMLIVFCRAPTVGCLQFLLAHKGDRP